MKPESAGAPLNDECTFPRESSRKRVYHLLDDVPKGHSMMAHNPWLNRIWQTNQWKPAIQAYLACTALVDDLVGQIVGAIEESPYADNTIIVLWSDHGFQLGEKGRWGKYSL